MSHASTTAERVLVLCEPGRAGAAALDLARAAAELDGAQVTAVSIAPQVGGGLRCGFSVRDYNEAVLDAAAAELERAREALGADATFKLLIEDVDPPLADWCAAHGFDLALLPARRRLFRASGHPAAAALRRAGAEVRIACAAAAARS